jgi:hypothetical protein
MDINKLISVDFAKPCNANNIVKLLPSLEERIININNATTKISLSIPVNPCLILSMVWKESTFRSSIKKNGKMRSLTSIKGAKGLLQVLPSTEKEVIQKMGYELNKLITLNLDSKLTGKELQELSVGAYYMHTLVSKFNNEDFAIIAYNEGYSRVMKKLGKGVLVGQNHSYLKEVRKNLVAMR